MSKDIIKTEIYIDEKVLQTKLENLIDDATMLEIHNLFAKMCDKYVPMLEGPLHESALAQVTSEYVQYGGSEVPYAYYQYTGEDFNFTKDYHPLATAYWDEVMMLNEGESFKQQVTEILKRRAKKLYG